MDQLTLGLSTWGSVGQDRHPNSNRTADDTSNPHSSTPCIVHQSARTSIYRYQDTGIKILLGGNLGDPQPHQWQINRLTNEQNVSRSLPLSCKKREVLNIQPFNGHPVALYFKWANGITLKEWMNNCQSGAPSVMTMAFMHGSYNDISNIQHNNSRRVSYNNGNMNMMSHGSSSAYSSHSNSLMPLISTLAPRSTDDLNVRLRAAMAIAKTLSAFHDGGAAHNRLTPDNVVLDTFEGDYVATLIDLSEAVVFNNQMTTSQGGRVPLEDLAAYEKQMKQDDLKSLGALLKQLFRGFEDENNDGKSAFQSLATSNSSALALSTGAETPFETWGDELRSKRKKQTDQISGEGLPIYLRSLISTLLLAGSEGSNSNSPASTVRYESARDVYQDLKVMLESQNQFYRKTELDERMMGSRLTLNPNMFYGRQVQMSMLMHLFQSVVVLGNQPSIATISGHPGTGKSTLVNQIKKPIQDKAGCFIEGKFCKLSCPDTVLSGALNNFFGSIISNRSMSCNMHMSLRWRIHDAIGSGNNILMEAIPNLRKLLADETSSTQTQVNTGRNGRRNGSLGSSHRLKFMYCKLISAIASKEHPLILFLDDLQWADEMTLDVMRMIVTDPDVQHFLFIGAYRDNEVSSAHPLTDKLNDLKEQGINVVTIKIGPIEKECVNALVSEALCLPPNLCRQLSTVIHSKTGGIIMFLLRFLKSLNDEGLLWFSLSSRRWEFDLEKIRTKQISADVVQHMTLNMGRLHTSIQNGLKIAACLGSNLDAEILHKAKNDDDFDVDDFLQKCVEDGYLTRITGTHHYAWAHDQVHQAAYELIPIAKRESFHLLLGSRLLMHSPGCDSDDMLFYVVDNMNRGIKLLESPAQKGELAFLNLRAGEWATSSSAFHSASRYLITGLSLLDYDSWETNYSLTIRLYDAVSEALYVTGDFSRLTALVERPLKFAQCFEDKLNIYNNLVRSFTASGQLDQGIATCLQVLDQLNEQLPLTITPEVFRGEFIRVKTMLEGMSNDQILSLPVMTDAKKLAAMQFLNHLSYQVYVAKLAMGPIISFRMVEMTIRYGVCNIAPFAFGVYGAFLVSTINFDLEGGYRMGRIATELMKRMNAIEIIPRLYTTIYGMINIWKEPFQASLSKHLEAFDIGAHRGDMEFAISNLFQYVNMSIYGCGEKFDGLIKNIHAYTKRAFQCQQHMAGKCLIVAHQLAFEFMGVDQNAYSLYFPGTTEESCFDSSRRNNQSAICRYICQKRKHVAFWTGDMDAAADMYELYKQFPLGSNTRQVGVLVGTFIDGLIAFYFARKHRNDEAKWTAIGEDVMATLQKWEEGSTWNFRNKRLLLEAEFNFLRGDDHMAMNCYTASINAARAHRLYHEEGLAYEKAATFLLHKKNYDGALDCFMNAKKCYETWGAHGIVDRVERAVAVLLPLCAEN